MLQAARCAPCGSSFCYVLSLEQHKPTSAGPSWAPKSHQNPPRSSSRDGLVHSCAQSPFLELRPARFVPHSACFCFSAPQRLRYSGPSVPEADERPSSDGILCPSAGSQGFALPLGAHQALAANTPVIHHRHQFQGTSAAQREPQPPPDTSTQHWCPRPFALIRPKASSCVLPEAEIPSACSLVGGAVPPSQ